MEQKSVLAKIKQINDKYKTVYPMVDFSNLFHRIAHYNADDLMKYAWKDWTKIKRGVISYIIQYRNHYKNARVILNFDKKDKNMKYWRNVIMKPYKENRNKKPKKLRPNHIPREILEEQKNIMVEELIENFAWKSLWINGMEADEQIAVLSKTLADKDHAVVIYSPDHDFNWLIDDHVYIFDTLRNAFSETTKEESKKLNFEHIVRGDSNDGVPNYLSDEDTLINPNKTQKKLFQTKLNTMWYTYKEHGEKVFEETYLTTPELKRRYVQNKKVVDLLNLPKKVKLLILNKFKENKPEYSKKKVWKYLANISHTKLVHRLDEFKNG